MGVCWPDMKVPLEKWLEKKEKRKGKETVETDSKKRQKFRAENAVVEEAVDCFVKKLTFVIEIEIVFAFRSN